MRLFWYAVSCLISSILGGGVVLAWLVSGEAELSIQKLTVTDRDEAVRIVLGVKNGRAFLSLHGADSRPRAITSVDQDGVPSVILSGKGNKPAFIATTKNEEPQLFLYDTDRQGPRIALSILESVPSIAVYDKKENATWGVLENGSIVHK